MPQNPDNVVDPGLVDVVAQGDGPLSVDQPVIKSPSTNPGPFVPAGDETPGTGNDSPDQPVTVSRPATMGLNTVDADVFSPQSARTINTTENTVINQVYGSPNPPDVYV